MSPPRHVLKCKREARLSVSYGRDISSRDRAVPSCLISRNSGWSVSDRVDLDSLRQSPFTASPFRLKRSINCICTPLQLSVCLINADPTRPDPTRERVYFFFLRFDYRKGKEKKKKKNEVNFNIKIKEDTFDVFGRHTEEETTLLFARQSA